MHLEYGDRPMESYGLGDNFNVLPALSRVPSERSDQRRASNHFGSDQVCERGQSWRAIALTFELLNTMSCWWV